MLSGLSRASRLTAVDQQQGGVARPARCAGPWLPHSRRTALRAEIVLLPGPAEEFPDYPVRPPPRRRGDDGNELRERRPQENSPRRGPRGNRRQGLLRPGGLQPERVPAAGDCHGTCAEKCRRSQGLRGRAFGVARLPRSVLPRAQHPQGGCEHLPQRRPGGNQEHPGAARAAARPGVRGGAPGPSWTSFRCCSVAS